MPTGTIREPRVIESAKVVAEKIQLAKKKNVLGKTVFFIGAGCSVTAGVPSAPQIAKMMVREIADRLGLCSEDNDSVRCYKALVSRQSLRDAGLLQLSLEKQTDSTIDWYRIYDNMFEIHYSTRDDTRELFASVIDKAGGAINWAHLCLGELVARGFISTVLTTNFDQLVLSGLVRSGVLPVVCDGIESLNRIAYAPSHPQLIELHGSRHTYVLRNRPDDVIKYREDPTATGAIHGLIQHSTTFITVGYAGREEGVMNLLVQAARVFDDKNLFWVQHSEDPKALGPLAAQFLSTTRNGGLLLGQDADVFFLELCKALGVGAPTAIADPLHATTKTIKDVNASTVNNNDIRNEIKKANERVVIAQAALRSETLAHDDIKSRIRELRLSGRDAAAYSLAQEALAR